jgi:hypothetical protein
MIMSSALDWYETETKKEKTKWWIEKIKFGH